MAKISKWLPKRGGLYFRKLDVRNNPRYKKGLGLKRGNILNKKTDYSINSIPGGVAFLSKKAVATPSLDTAKASSAMVSSGCGLETINFRDRKKNNKLIKLKI